MSVLNDFSWLKDKKKSDYFHLLVVYAVSHVGLLFNSDGIWWDDWTLFGTSPSALRDEYQKLGSFPPGLANIVIFLNELGPISYRLTTFLCYLASTLVLYKIISRDYDSYQLAFPIAILFAVMPVNSARIAAINVGYAICLSLFLVAGYLVRKHIGLGIAILFTSYVTASLLPFTLLILLNEIVYFKKRSIKFGDKSSIKKLSLIFVLPLVYWSIKNIWFKPSGIYSDYNQHFDLSNLPYQIKTSFLSSFSLTFSFIALIIAFCLLYLIWWNLALPNSINVKTLFLGFAILILGAFPYWIVGLIPSDQDWMSRHQLLMPFGLSLILSYILLKNSRVNKILFVLVVSLSVSWWTNTYSNYASETRYQDSIVSELIHIHSEVRECTEFVIEEIRIDRNSERPVKRFYEWNGMLTSAGFGEQVTVIPNGDTKGFDSGKYDLFFNSIYKASDFMRSSENVRCRLEVTELATESFVKIQVSEIVQP
jgi:hypothetical protein